MANYVFYGLVRSWRGDKLSDSSFLITVAVLRASNLDHFDDPNDFDFLQ